MAPILANVLFYISKPKITPLDFHQLEHSLTLQADHEFSRSVKPSQVKYIYRFPTVLNQPTRNSHLTGRIESTVLEPIDFPWTISFFLSFFGPAFFRYELLVSISSAPVSVLWRFPGHYATWNSIHISMHLHFNWLRAASALSYPLYISSRAINMYNTASVEVQACAWDRVARWQYACEQPTAPCTLYRE